MLVMKSLKRYLTPPRVAETSKNHVAGWWFKRVLLAVGFVAMLAYAAGIIFWYWVYGWNLANHGQDTRVKLVETHQLREGKGSKSYKYFQSVQLEDGRLAHLSLSPCPADTIAVGSEIPVRWLDLPDESLFTETRTLGDEEKSVQRAIWLPEDGLQPSWIEYVSPNGLVFSGLYVFFVLMLVASYRSDKKRKAQSQPKH